MSFQIGTDGLLAKLVWVSTTQSIEQSRVSILACVEVLFCVFLWWYIFYLFGTFNHLLISIFVAPIVLLRSDASVERGKKIWLSLGDNARADDSYWKFMVAVIPSVLMSALFGWLVVKV